MKVGKDHSVHNCKGRGSKKGEIIAFGNISYGCDDALLPLVFFLLTYKQSEKGVSSPSPLSLSFTWVRGVDGGLFLKRIY